MDCVQEILRRRECDDLSKKSTICIVTANFLMYTRAPIDTPLSSILPHSHNLITEPCQWCIFLTQVKLKHISLPPGLQWSNCKLIAVGRIFTLT